jgi:anti-sigma regulatory factor (Ser/Thr protein kinase)
MSGVPPERAGHDQLIPPLFDLSLAPTVAAPARARAELTAWLERQPHDASLVEVAVLLATELVTNCVRHARITADEPLRLTASLHPTTLRLELWDNGTDGSVTRRATRPDQTGGGYGLDLVAQLSSEWGVDRDDHGTTVWLELPTDADTA